MGLLAQTAKTYDTLIGANKNVAPLFHVSKKIKIIVFLTSDGNLLNINALEKKDLVNGIIPATEEALSRTSSKIVPFPLIDNAKYFIEERKVDAFLSALREWCEFDSENVVIKAVYNYVAKRTMENDLKQNGIKINLDDRVGWKIALDGKEILTWNNKDLIKSFTDFSIYKNKDKNKETFLCMISGNNQIPMNKVPKIAFFGNAKLISSDDKSDFSFRGRFFNSCEALSVGQEYTQKAINALSWLCENQSICIDGSVLLCWNPNGHFLPMPIDPLIPDDTLVKRLSASDYMEALDNYILLKKTGLDIEKEDVVTVILEKPTKNSGRLSIKFYNELCFDDFLLNLGVWDRSCCWYDTNNKIIRSPCILDIVKYAVGNGTDFSINDNCFYKSYCQILIERRVNKGRIPTEIEKKLVNRCSNLQLYMKTTTEKGEAKTNQRDIDKLLFVTCSVIRKYFIDRGEREFLMSLEKDLKNRSYQYGRLLAVFEKIEQEALSANETKRTTNAIRMQSMFVRRPGLTSKIILEKLKCCYYPRFSEQKEGLLAFYEKLIGEIMNNISSFPLTDFDKPLDETYIMGYYLQKNEFYKKKNTDSEESRV